MRTRLFLITLLGLFSLFACSGGSSGSDSPGNDYSKPILYDLTISGISSGYIEIEKPVLSVAGLPEPSVEAFIGINGTITISGPVVSGYTEGTVNVSQNGHRFSGLTPFASYRIIVVAQNMSGYSVRQIVQNTNGISPVLNNLNLPGSDSGSISLGRPTFETAGNPLPSVMAYIGVKESISVSGPTVNNFIGSPVDVSANGCVFSGLNSNTGYKIVVVAQNCEGYFVRQIEQSTKAIAPALGDLVIENHDTGSITIGRPALSIAGNPAPAVRAYIGEIGTISFSGKVVSNYTGGSIDVSASGYQFSGLDLYTTYKIIVVAENSEGYSVKQIIQSTDGISPVLNDLSIDSFDSASITLAHPSFSTSGNPSAIVRAYIGLSSQISVTGDIVSNYTGTHADVSTGGHQFSGLSSYTAYRIIVVAQNGEGYSVKDISQSTRAVRPDLNNLEIESSDPDSISLKKPTFNIAGNPSPAVLAYIGEDGTITVAGKAVSNYIGTYADVSASGHQFNSLDPCTAYRLIVVAENTEGYSVKQIIQSTRGIAPELNDPAITNFDSGSIMLEKPAFSVAGNPSPSVLAYIGVNNSITVEGSTVSNFIGSAADVSSGDYQFTGLDSYTDYKLIVVARNNEGYSIKQIVQSTSGIAPVLNDPAVGSFDSGSITLRQPTFSTAGNPAPAVFAYIGVNGTISAAGSGVTNFIEGDINVMLNGYQFSCLDPSVEYKIIVVAQNIKDYSVKEIVQTTGNLAPVLNSLVISDFDTTSIVLEQPTFEVRGGPAASVEAYIGYEGTISVTNNAVSDFIQGPIDVSTGGCEFSGLATFTKYKIITVAQNIAGYSVKQIKQKTASEIRDHFVVTGYYTIAYVGGPHNWFTKKFNTDVVETWSRAAPVFSSSDSGGSIAGTTIDSNNNVYVCGNYRYYGDIQYGTIVKFDANGVRDSFNWDLNFSGISSFSYIVTDKEDYIYAVGTVRDTSDSFIMKFDPNGAEDTVNWNKTFPNSFTISDTKIDSDNNLFIAGCMSNGTNYDWYIRRFSSDGVEDIVNWNKMIDSGYGDDYSCKMIIDKKKNIYISGLTGAGPCSSIKKFSKDGDEIVTNWDKRIPSLQITSLAADSNNNLYVIGYKYNGVSGSNSFDWIIKKFNEQGVEDMIYWNRAIEGGYKDSDMPYSAFVDSYDNLIVAGELSNSSHYKDIWIKKYNSRGTQLVNKIIDYLNSGYSDEAQFCFPFH